MKNLLIVESPAKSKTIKKYLGKDFEVLPSVGHVRDLEPVDGAVDVENDFAMKWKILPGKQKNISAIAQAVKKAENVFLSPDPDREGEAIAWHLYDILNKKKAFEGKNVKRVVFNEITKTAIQKALKEPREIDQNMVDAYLARRALDFEVGFKLSPVLWKKLPGSKSAGRVQSVALRVLCEREDEIEKFVPVEYHSIEGKFVTEEGKEFNSKLSHYNGVKLDKFAIKTSEEGNKIVEDLNVKDYSVAAIEKKKSQRRPYAPFTTSTLQQDASRKLGFAAKHTMRVAQKLYEGVDLGGETVGLITYMRTDSVALSKEAVEGARSFIGKQFDSNYLPEKPIFYANKSKNSQEAHEAVRPTNLSRTPKSIQGYLDKDQYRLYELIWKRTVASQMSNAVINQVAVDIVSEDKNAVFRATGSMIGFDGFLVLYNEAKDEKEEDSKMLPKMEEGQGVDKKSIFDEEHFTQAPPRYTEASLVKKLEEMGIGRPSTYANILDVIQLRNYARIEKKRFVCEDRGRIVVAFLKDFFAKYVEYDFTAGMENNLDEIANGDKQWKNVMMDFWTPFMDAVGKAHDLSNEEVADKLTNDLAIHLFHLKDGDSIEEARKCPDCGNGKLSLKLGKFGGFIGCSNYPECRYTRQLAINPDDKYVDEKNAKSAEDGTVEFGEIKGKKLTLRKGPYGHYVQLGEMEKGTSEKPKRVSLPKGVSPEEIDEKKAKFLIALPKKVAEDAEGNKIEVGIGRYGPYIKKGSAFVSIPAGQDLFTISKEVALDLASKARESAKKVSAEVLGKDDKGNEVLYYASGRYGPYVKSGKKSASVDKDLQAKIAGGEKLTLEIALELLSKK
jgi:DNA topoisomerase-1